MVPQSHCFVSKKGNKCHFRKGCEPSYCLRCSHRSSLAPTFVVLRMLEGTSLHIPFTVCFGLQQHQDSMQHQCNWESIPKPGWVLNSLTSVSAFPPWEICPLQQSFPLCLGFTSSCVPVLRATSGQEGLGWQPQELILGRKHPRCPGGKGARAAPSQRNLSLPGDGTS